MFTPNAPAHINIQAEKHQHLGLFSSQLFSQRELDAQPPHRQHFWLAKRGDKRLIRCMSNPLIITKGMEFSSSGDD